MNIPEDILTPMTSLGTLLPADAPAGLGADDIRDALGHPTWPGGDAPTVFDFVRPGEKVCFVVSDHTRKAGADRVMPVIVAGLREKGCRAEDMGVLVASGIHRHSTAEELRGILGDAVAAAVAGRVWMHDPDDAKALVDVGTTARGHAVRVNRRVVSADRVVLVGSASYHYHAGFGGGRKSLVPGVAARETIAYTHSLTLDPKADRLHPNVAPGVLDGNPVAAEMLECARLCGECFVVNTVLTPGGEVVGVFSGELDAAHRAACRMVETISRVDIAEQADLVIASAGTARDWIQSHKALFNASRAAKPTGTIILQAPCPEGLGNDRFRHWLRKRDPAILFRELRHTPEVNGQTALSTIIRGRQTILVTNLPAADIADLGIETAPSIEAAVQRVVAGMGDAKGTYYLVPEARYVVPFVSRCADERQMNNVKRSTSN